ncbi:glycoside hydrolase family 43 protein [Paenibacillus doosanensis]|uniref:glycoside hydrolase family 43 protein n=1 Tax=Paenibacillus doosanensis TaxID=1229154 RepID=UPI00217FBECA|nr:glycoside hydrolase family 43 protein [Paenibacillus doosanensis]MCS7464337.1 glycoside hydrolase family 43 protein [Paenibacillus doosanensis]
METFRNPVLPGFYPDPSICRVGEDYYMVTSSFEYFPGVPIFHSKDLVHWRQLGHVLDRPSQLDLDETPSSKGIYAATIRHHNGIFYMITTFVVSATGARRNFYVTAENPTGPWSDPHWLPDAPGIDPSLFFDEDGKAYVMANRMPPEGQQYPKHMEIWLQELDLEHHRLVGPKYSLWDGALKQIHAQEGPHLYKINGYYYLLIAEGGTGFTHSVTIARSESITGPYENCKMNPILTHRHLGRGYPITNVGHADIVETENGEWWMVCLASRPYGGDFRNLGRETFLVPFRWESGWPVVNPGKGIVELELPRPNLPEHRWPSEPVCDHFESSKLGLQWNFIRTPRGEYWSLTERPGYLRLKLKPERMTECANPSFVGRRQQHMNFAMRTVMEFKPRRQGETAGAVLLQNQDYQFRMEHAYTEARTVIRLVERKAGEERLLAERPVDASRLYLKVEAVGQAYHFYYGTEAEVWHTLAENADGTILSTDVAGGFIGAYIGLFASSEGQASEAYADFDWFEYREI